MQHLSDFNIITSQLLNTEFTGDQLITAAFDSFFILQQQCNPSFDLEAVFFLIAFIKMRRYLI